jgi:hypothetical protein
MTDLLDDILDRAGFLPIVSTNNPSEHDIRVFIAWKKEVMVTTYPLSTSKWRKRYDCGSHSQHRWGLYDENSQECVQLVVMHNACVKSVFLQNLCRNCEFRHVWRQLCLTPQNLFYILPLVEIERCEALLNPLLISHCGTTIDVLTAYEKTTPKAAMKIKKIKSTPKKRIHLDKLENDIRESVRRSNMRDKSMMTPEHKQFQTFMEEEENQLLQTFREAEEQQLLQPFREAEEQQEQTFEEKEKHLQTFRETEEKQLQTLQEKEKQLQTFREAEEKQVQTLLAAEERQSTVVLASSDSKVGGKPAALDEFATVKRVNPVHKRDRDVLVETVAKKVKLVLKGMQK